MWQSDGAEVIQPAWERDGVKLYLGDCLEILPELEMDSIHAVVTDPPYGLGFMGKDWDHGVPGKNFWVEALRIAKPGAHLLAFGGTRTHHRLACAIEDAGWEIRDCIMWLYGQGFPKSLDVSKAAGAEREVVGSHPYANRGTAQSKQAVNLSGSPEREQFISAPATDAAKQWAGWGTALKPAWEPVILARKPISETNVATNVLQHGTGALNIDGCRIAGTEPNPSIARRASAAKSGKAGMDLHSALNKRSGIAPFKKDLSSYIEGHTGEVLGRWPANVILSHHPECVLRGTKRVKASTNGGSCSKPGTHIYGGGYRGDVPAFDYADADGLETVEDWECHPDCPVGMFPSPHGAGIATDGKTCRGKNVGYRKEPGAFQYGGDAPRFGDSGSAARFFYCAKASRRERGEGNAHSTVKPIALIRYLVRLVTPPGGIVLDPFLGSGTTVMACEREGFSCIGVEKDATSLGISVKRIEAEMDRFPLFEQKRNGYKQTELLVENL